MEDQKEPCCEAFGKPVVKVLVWFDGQPAKYAYVSKRIVERAIRIKIRTGAPEGDKVAHER